MLEVQRKGEKILIAVDQDMISNDYFLKFMERMELEELAKKSKLTEEDATSISESMKEDWWQKNKKQLLEGIDE